MDDFFKTKLYNLKVRQYYWENYVHQTVVVNRGIKIFLAILSSGSVAAWAIWQQYPIFWAILIAASQVVSVIYDFLPYNTRISDLTSLIVVSSRIALEMEKCYFDYCFEEITETEAKDKYFQLLKEEDEAENKCFLESSLPLRNRYAKEAYDEATAYFLATFGEDTDEMEHEQITRESAQIRSCSQNGTSKRKTQKSKAKNKVRHDGSLPIQPSVPKMPEPKRPQKPQSKP